MPENIEKLKQRLRVELTDDANLLAAVTHRSYAVENNIAYDNQRLEFLGDAVLEIILSDILFHRYPEADEGLLTRMRSGVVRESSLALLARHIELGSYLLTGKGELEVNGAERDSTLADLFEAVLGALYLELGLEKVKAIVAVLIDEKFPDPASMVQEINPKGALQEFSQGAWNEQPVYTVSAVNGPEHQPTYEVEVSLHGHTAIGRAPGRKSAEMAAARLMLDYLRRAEIIRS